MVVDAVINIVGLDELPSPGDEERRGRYAAYDISGRWKTRHGKLPKPTQKNYPGSFRILRRHTLKK